MTKPNPITLLAIDHVVIRTKHVERLLSFYRDVIGCSLERRRDEIGLTQLRAGVSLIDLVDADGEIGRMGGGPPRDDARNMDHFCLQVEPWDAAAITAFLRAQGVAVGKVETRYGARGTGPSIYIKDPDGNVVELKGPPES